MIDPEVVRDAALRTRGVVGMHPGPHGTAATFAAHGRIWGIRIDTTRIDIHVVGETGQHLAELGRSVQDAVRVVLPDYAGDVVVHIEDLGVAQPTAHPDEAGAPAVLVNRTEEPGRTP